MDLHPYDIERHDTTCQNKWNKGKKNQWILNPTWIKLCDDIPLANLFLGKESKSKKHLLNLKIKKLKAIHFACPCDRK
jgi:hypothetical protein